MSDLVGNLRTGFMVSWLTPEKLLGGKNLLIGKSVGPLTS